MGLPISSAMNDPRKVDIYSAAHKRDPFPLYAFLRSEAPVFEVRVPVLKRAWLITRYDDVVPTAIGSSKTRAMLG